MAREGMISMNSFVQALIVMCIFLGYVFTVAAKPKKFELKTTKKKDDIISEVCITLENDIKKKN